MMFRDPDDIPLKPGIFALINGRRRFVYVSYTGNLQKRSHSMSHMLMAFDADPAVYWPIRDLPKHASDEFTFKVERVDRRPAVDARAAVAAVQREWVDRNYRVIGGHRAAGPAVTVGGQRMTLADAVRKFSDAEYLTVYRRLERGWEVRQALGLDPPAPRWHKKKQAARRAREAERATA